MPIVRIDSQKRRVEIDRFEIDNSVVFNYFDNLPSGDKDSKFLRAIYIGVLALMEDRISAFLSKTSNELGTELESLKMIFDMKSELFFKTAIKGNIAEEEIALALEEYFAERKIKDRIELTGNSVGQIPKNKTGDIICFLDGQEDKRIVIECKFDKSLRLGDIDSKDIFTKRTDTAWSQLIEAQVNRNAKAAIIVFDRALIDSSILKQFDSVGYIPEIGLCAIVDSQRGDYRNLYIAYSLARDIALSATALKLDQHTLAIIIRRIVKDLTGILGIKNIVKANIDNNLAILKELEKGMIVMQFNYDFLVKFLRDGNLTKEDLLQFYNGEDAKEKYRASDKEIKALLSET